MKGKIISINKTYIQSHSLYFKVSIMNIKVTINLINFYDLQRYSPREHSPVILSEFRQSAVICIFQICNPTQLIRKKHNQE